VVQVAPITVPISYTDLMNWSPQICTSNSGCTDHSLSILNLITPTQYVAGIQYQNANGIGRNVDEVEWVMRQVVPGANRFIINADKAQLNYIFSQMPVNTGTIAMINDDNEQRVNQRANHTVVLANVIQPGSDGPVPVLIDGSTQTLVSAIPNILGYLNMYRAGCPYDLFHASLILFVDGLTNSIYKRRMEKAELEEQSAKLEEWTRGEATNK
jgi:hypothetical protein